VICNADGNEFRGSSGGRLLIECYAYHLDECKTPALRRSKRIELILRELDLVGEAGAQSQVGNKWNVHEVEDLVAEKECEL
jgi:hypothetical protein